MSLHIVSENTVAGADVDGIHFVAVDERVLRHDVPLWGFGVGQGKEVRSFAGHKGVVRSDWYRKDLISINVKVCWGNHWHME